MACAHQDVFQKLKANGFNTLRSVICTLSDLTDT